MLPVGSHDGLKGNNHTNNKNSPRVGQELRSDTDILLFEYYFIIILMLSR
jgi:hypothetical protein